MKRDFEGQKILLGVCGGIAAYKSAQLVRELTRHGALVRVVMTDSAKAFVSPMTFQALSGHEVRSELLDPQAERAMGHIELARWADCLVVAPASANCLAKFAQGIADDLLSTLYLVSQTPVMLCPAMNRSMWAHPATQANRTLLEQRGVMIVGPEDGEQACGEYGLGRMSEPETIIETIRLQEIARVLAGRSVLITAGPTREAIDPVRYLSNRSSGTMGYALARAAAVAGAHVTLISGPTALPPPLGVVLYRVNSAKEMQRAVAEVLQTGMIFIAAAAVSDYRVDSPSNEKIKKSSKDTLTLQLSRNPDILSMVSASKKAAYLVGFAAETTDVIQHAKAKLQAKQLNLVVANQVGEGYGFEQAWNQVTILSNQDTIALPLMHKTRLAARIIAILAANLQNNASKNSMKLDVV